MGLERVIVHVMDAAERATIEAELSRFGAVESTGWSVYGMVPEEDLAGLKARGFLVERPVAPARRAPPAHPTDESLIVDAVDSPLNAAGRRAKRVYVVETEGSLRPGWIEQLTAAGLRMLSVDRGAAITVELDDHALSAMKLAHWVRNVREYGPLDTARGFRLPLEARGTPAMVEYDVLFERSADASGANAAIEGTIAPDIEAVMTKLAEDPRVRDSDVISRACIRFSTAHAQLVDEIRTMAGVREVTTERTYEIVWHDVAPEQVAAVIDALRQDPRASDVQVGKRHVRFRCDGTSPLLVTLSRIPQTGILAPYVDAEFGNAWARRVVGVDGPVGAPASVNGGAAAAIGWTGRGVVVGVADSGVCRRHVDLKDRIQKVIRRAPSASKDDPVGHGTHVCGTIAGTGAGCNGTVRGISPDATLVVQSLADDDGKLAGKPLDLTELYQEALNEGVHIHTNSWGTKSEGRVSSDSIDIDRFVYENPDFFVIFAAGNDGAWRGDRAKLFTLRAPGTAKNVLSVGACCSGRVDGPYVDRKTTLSLGPGKTVVEPFVGDAECIPVFSSCGPSEDGRVKPDLVAPGTSILSAWPVDEDLEAPMPETALASADARYAWWSGTSFATPVVAGAAACVRQYFVEGRGIQPSAALMRATMIHATTWLTRETTQDASVGRPNFHQGHGRLDLGVLFGRDAAGALPTIVVRDVSRLHAEALYFNPSLGALPGHPDRWAARVRVRAGATRPLRITLAWTDRPDRQLQQDLDLAVRIPGQCERVTGNPALRRMEWAPNDRDNNLEHIVLENPVPGEYLVVVGAFLTPYEPQGYALVVSGDLDGDDWIDE